MKPDWQSIDTVLLDMDGTLLDLNFDNYFWLEHLPNRYAEQHGLESQHATDDLFRRFASKQGTLEWYCLDYWSRELQIDIVSLKREVAERIRARPKVKAFLRRLGELGKRRILITNAHPHSLQLKLSATRIEEQLDHIFSSHQFGWPKEHEDFWKKLRNEVNFDPQRTLFIDDSEVILESAQAFGIAHVLCVEQPDSELGPRNNLRYPAIKHFSQILDLMDD